jgi:uncharacterized protein (UPF0548 family)
VRNTNAHGNRDAKPNSYAYADSYPDSDTELHARVANWAAHGQCTTQSGHGGGRF